MHNMEKNVSRNSNNVFKNSKNILNFVGFLIIPLIIWCLLGLWSMNVEKVIYGENKYSSNLVVGIVLGIATLVVHQTAGGSIILSSLCCIQNVYQDLFKDKIKLNFCHLIMIILFLGINFCLYFVHFYLEVYFQKPDKIPEVFSSESFKYFLAGILKPMIIIVIYLICFIIDLTENNIQIGDIKGRIKHSSKVSSIV